MTILGQKLKELQKKTIKLLLFDFLEILENLKLYMQVLVYQKVK